MKDARTGIIKDVKLGLHENQQILALSLVIQDEKEGYYWDLQTPAISFVPPEPLELDEYYKQQTLKFVGDAKELFNEAHVDSSDQLIGKRVVMGYTDDQRKKILQFI